MRNLLIVGSGGHGKVVAETASLAGKWNEIAFLDDQFPIDKVLSWPIVGKVDDAAAFLSKYSDLIVAIGNNKLRVSLLARFQDMGYSIPTIIHPTAFISNYAEISDGTVVFANCVINAGCDIGIGSIINTGSTVDHDCTLAHGVHISPGAHLAGGVHVGEYSWLGIGSIVIQQISIGDNVIVGAGSVIIDDIENDTTVVGVPGRVIKRRNEGR